MFSPLYHKEARQGERGHVVALLARANLISSECTILDDVIISIRKLYAVQWAQFIRSILFLQFNFIKLFNGGLQYDFVWKFCIDLENCHF